MRFLNAVLALALLAPAAAAKSKVNVKLDDPDALTGPVFVPKGETRDGDLVVRGSVTVEGVLNGDMAVMEGEVLIKGVVNGDVATLGSPVTVTGQLNGDIATAGGAVRIDGVVRGEVASMGGSLELGPKAELTGDAALLGGSFKKAPGAKFTGEVSQLDLGVGRGLVRLAEKIGKHHLSPEAQEKRRKARLFASIAFYLGSWFMITLVAALLPDAVDSVAAAVRRDLWRAAGYGLLLCLAFVPALVLMAVSLVGIPLIPLALLAAVAAKLLAFSAYALLIADRVGASLKRPVVSTLTGVAGGYLVLISPLLVGKLLLLAGAGGLGGVLVLLNLILLSFGAVAGLGGVFLTRFGTRKA